MIDIKNLCKSYGNNKVYDNFDLRLQEGKITCVLGESGCGKTTLLNCIARLTPFEGEITSVKCSYIFQSPRLVPNLTVRGNLKLVCKDDKKIDGYLERVGLAHKADEYPKSLSGGQAQRVAIARAFAYGGSLMLMDEPFSSLNLRLKMSVISLFHEIFTENGATALFVTHDIDEAIALSHRIVVISGGKIAYDSAQDKDAEILSMPFPREYGGEERFRKKLLSILA